MSIQRAICCVVIVIDSLNSRKEARDVDKINMLSIFAADFICLREVRKMHSGAQCHILLKNPH